MSDLISSEEGQTFLGWDSIWVETWNMHAL